MPRTATFDTKKQRYNIIYDNSVAKVLAEQNCVIAVSTYQAGKVILVGANEEAKLVQIPVSFMKPMGIALSGARMAVATLDEIQIFANSPSLARSFPYLEQSLDALYLPRATYYCGEVDLHDLSFGKGGIWAVNTGFSCISTFDSNYSFVPRWKPNFITELKPEDRCHLNGMAMKDDLPAFATALSSTDIKEGWRDNITTGGVLMSVPDGEVLLSELAMPHSPRIINGELYFLQSATGTISRYNPDKKVAEELMRIPGFIRGLDAIGNYLFVGLSKVRKTSKTFNKLPVSEMSDYAGVIVIDMTTFEIAGGIQYDAFVEEIFDVRILPGVNTVGIITPGDDRHKLAVSLKNNSFWKNKK